MIKPGAVGTTCFGVSISRLHFLSAVGTTDIGCSHQDSAASIVVDRQPYTTEHSLLLNAALLFRRIQQKRSH